MWDATTRTPQGLRRLRSWLKRRAGPPRRELIAARGWPGEALVGRQAAGAAWLLAQHADRRPDFQRECLELLAAAVTAGDADPQHGALLEDRVLVAQGQRQVFGTQ
ncbi:DUF6624 domain-containing protein [Streptomyces mirabilis]